MTRKQSRPLYCSFCGKSPKEVGPFVETTTQGEAARICVRCTAEAKRTFEEAAKKDSAGIGDWSLFRSPNRFTLISATTWSDRTERNGDYPLP